MAIKSGRSGSSFLDHDKWHDDMIRVVVCDDVPLLRRRLVVALEAEPDIDVMAEAGDGEYAITVCRELAPDVVVLGMRIDLGGPLTVAGIREVVPSAHVVMLITHEDEEEAVRAIKAGATGFLNRDRFEQAATVIRAVSAGIVALPPLVAQRVLNEYELFEQGEHDVHLEPPVLEDRERAILEAVSKGQTYAAAAADLGVQDHAARNLAANAVEKLYRYARTEAVLYAVGEKLFTN